jgi:hypothetical protein
MSQRSVCFVTYSLASLRLLRSRRSASSQQERRRVCADFSTSRPPLPLTQEARLAAGGWRGLQLDLARSHAPQRSWERQLHNASAAMQQLPAPAAAPPGGAAGGVLPTRVRAATMRDAVDATEIAWASLLGRELPMEGLTRQILTLVGSSQAFTRRLAKETAARHGASPTLTAWTVRASINQHPTSGAPTSQPAAAGCGNAPLSALQRPP